MWNPRNSSHRRTFAGIVVAGATVTITLTGCSSDSSPGSTPSGTASATASTVGSPSAQVTTILQQGITQATKGDATAAATSFNNVLAIDPGNKYAHYNLGLLAQQRGDNKAALAAYDQALKTDGNYTPALYNKAIITESTDVNAAIAIYGQILKVNPRASTALLRMSFCYDKIGNKAKATETRNQAISIDPALAKVATPTVAATPSATQG